MIKSNENNVNLDQINNSTTLSMEIKKNNMQESQEDQENGDWNDNDLEECYMDLYNELQIKYNDLLTQYQESIERANDLQSSLYYQQYRWQSLGYQLQMVIDDLSDESSSSINQSIQTLQQLKESISSLFLYDSSNSDCSSLSEMEQSMENSIQDSIQESIDWNDNLLEITQSLDILEKHINENGEVIDSLKDLSQPLSKNLQELQKKLQTLGSTNYILNDVIDSHNQEMNELSTSCNEMRREICNLRNAKIDYETYTSITIQQLKNQILSLQNTLSQEIEKTNYLQNELVKTEESYKKQIEEYEKELKKEEIRRNEMEKRDGEKQVLQREFARLSSSLSYLQQENERMKEQQVSIENLQQQLNNAEKMIRRLQERMKKQVEEQIIKTPVGEFSTLNPNAIIACIEDLMSKISSESARVTILEQQLKTKENEVKNAISKENDLQMKFNKLKKLYKPKQLQVESLQNEIEKYKKNEIIYRQMIVKLKEEIKQRDQKLVSIYTTINGINKRNIE